MDHSYGWWKNPCCTQWLHGRTGWDLFPCCIIAFGHWCWSWEQRITYCYTEECLLGIVPLAMKSVPYSPEWKISSLLAKSKNSKLVFQHLPLRDWFLHHRTQNSCTIFWEFGFLFRCKAMRICCSFPLATCDACVPLSAPELPMVLSDLYRTEYLSLDYRKLLEIAGNTHQSKPG